MASRITKILSGVSGQYFVAAELSRKGFVATVTLRNTRGIDILAANTDGTKSVGIQVKTNQGTQRKWLLSQKSEELANDRLFYVFVNLNGEDGQPTFHIVPADHVAKTISESHETWVKTPGRGGKARKDNPIRVFSDLDGEFLGKWDLLELD